MILIEIDSTSTKRKSGENAKGPWSMTFQQVSISGHMIDGFPAKHPRESTIQLDGDNPQPYPVGVYVIHPDSYFFGDFGRFTLGRLKLQPLKDFIAEFQKQMGAQVTFNQPKAA
ncbi:single-stranded DNA-binding protein [Azonexus sp.]|jgi:hypothetical protein|uniref:single-stranded DNA-binding protein n=1 Tax=Azonexus sp. TaxID=1872668 RepID=UPI0028339E6E|nr:single-stranded DNA-binding protein [Azonexus sp.]MDR1994034.1 G5P family DNA-binding protein [Azonexus sp.]